MNNEDIIERLVEVEQRSKSNTKRLDDVEQSFTNLHELTVAVREMAVKQGYIHQKVDAIDRRMGDIESQPAKRWEAIIKTIITTVVAVLVGYCLAKFGVK